MNASLAAAPTLPDAGAYAGNPTLDTDLTLALAIASRAAYDYYQNPDQPVTAPPGYVMVDHWTGWDALLLSGSIESFGVVFQSSAQPDTCIFAFRGTDSDLDAWEDVHFIPTTFVPTAGSVSPTPWVSSGFYGIYDTQGEGMTASMRAQLFALLHKYQPTQLYVTGHSLGAALSQLFSLDVAVSRPMGERPFSASNLNFASPMVGLDSWGSAYASQIDASLSIRVYNYWDYVPSLPPSTFDYCAVGTGFRTSFYVDKEWFPHLLARHALSNLTVVLDNALPLTPQQWQGSFPDQVAGETSWTMVSTYPPAGADVRWADQAQTLMKAEAAAAVKAG
ncbi:lipase family [Lysobacter enzymogenes]|uniref:Lipase family n=1 Tax=Lysobacter enzymogenes TaxID=69 RepID=A0A0S2DFR0_LYSEN|nr:lipase family protein [Lysobacter enzymogenes]ALN57377.1 lipase family [Lysobacter enzymogenes]QCW26001.1 lipase family protein [Lysobacter enzymogenes]